MRNIILHINSTFNGVVTGDPSKDKTNFMVWTTSASVEIGSEYLLKTMESVDTILLGRATYEDLSSKWPNIKEWGDISERVSCLGEKINNAHKLVVTSSDTTLAWGGFEAPKQLTGTNLEEQISELKSSEGGDIIIFGSPTLVRSLTDADLIDVYHVAVRPVVVNVGEHLFDNLKFRKDFQLVDAKALEGGTLLVTYKPVKTSTSQ